MTSKREQFNPKQFLRNLTHQPGVYRMYDASGDIIYVGKAKDLRKRVSSYFRSNLDHPKTQTLVKQIVNIEVTVTNTEAEALILENNFIKKYRPRYNVLLRDDKSYPYILLSDHQHPRLAFHRGTRREKGRYFGPFPNGVAVRNSLRLLQAHVCWWRDNDTHGTTAINTPKLGWAYGALNIGKLP